MNRKRSNSGSQSWTEIKQLSYSQSPSNSWAKIENTNELLNVEYDACITGLKRETEQLITQINEECKVELLTEQRIRDQFLEFLSNINFNQPSRINKSTINRLDKYLESFKNIVQKRVNSHRVWGFKKNPYSLETRLKEFTKHYKDVVKCIEKVNEKHQKRLFK